jgi:flagellar biosynthetic protein FliR
MLVVNMSFGVMSRSAPQMNVFAVGFPITLVFGLLLMWFGLSNFLPLFGDIIDEGFNWLHNIVDAS